MHLNLSALRSELEDFDSRRNWPALYMELLAYQEQLDYTTEAAHSKYNMGKNRYRDVLPSDEFRVRLNRQPDYINANRCIVPLEGLDINKSYIMTQGPMEETSGDFWEMVWQEKCTNIVMLTNTIENRTVKCHQYFPDVESPKSSYTSPIGKFVIKLITQRKSPDFTVRELSVEIEGSSSKRSITHFHYTGWPDHGVPENPVSFVKFYLYLSSLGVLPAIPKHNHSNGSFDSSESSPAPPPVLHCSAGIGRTGVLCVVDSCYSMLSNDVEVTLETIKGVIMELRRCRKGAVQTPEQLRFASFAVFAVGMALIDDRVPGMIADAIDSLETVSAGKKSVKRSIAEPVPEIPEAASSAKSQPNEKQVSATSEHPKPEATSAPSRRSQDSRFVQQENESKKRRTDFLSKNWYFWGLTRLQAATGNRQGLAVITLCVAAVAVGVGIWRRS